MSLLNHFGVGATPELRRGIRRETGKIEISGRGYSNVTKCWKFHTVKQNDSTYNLVFTRKDELVAENLKSLDEASHVAKDYVSDNF